MLIVGGAGSGKESLASIIAAFTENYAFGKRHTINMAALKPSAVVSTVVSGLAFSTSPSTKLEIHGVLANARREREREYKASYPGVGDSHLETELAKADDAPMLVLDELNSMEHDTQGVLLRFLEQAEIVPLGASTDPLDAEMASRLGKATVGKEVQDSRSALTNFLVVGMMNEDPDEISREKALEFVKDTEYLKGIVADMLYEHFMGLRRLRPDIKYRMIRGGKFEIPALRKRHHDIPMLFFDTLGRLAKASAEAKAAQLRLAMHARRGTRRPGLTLAGQHPPTPGRRG